MDTYTAPKSTSESQAH